MCEGAMLGVKSELLALGMNNSFQASLARVLREQAAPTVEITETPGGGAVAAPQAPLDAEVHKWAKLWEAGRAPPDEEPPLADLAVDLPPR